MRVLLPYVKSERTLSDQTSGSVDTGRVELDEFQILEGKTSSDDHGVSVSRTGVGRRAREVGSTVTENSPKEAFFNRRVPTSLYPVK